MIKPVGSHLLIRIIKQKTILDSGIVLPDNVKVNEKTKAIVEEVGTDCRLGIKKGHEVMFKPGAQGIELDADLHLIPEVSIAAIVNWVDE